MESICDLKLESIKESSWIRLVQVKFTQGEVEKKRDVTHSHDSCGILLHNITRDVFVFVRQFRPAVLMHDVGMKLLPVNGESCVNIENDTLQKGFTVELCAGIIDKKDKSVEETAALEVLEECGYRINFKDLEPISSTRNINHHSGTLQSMFYIKVTDDMKVDGYGGGNEEEGEFIQVVEVKVEDVLKSVFDDQSPRPVGWTFAIVWFCYTKALPSTAFALFPSLMYHFGSSQELIQKRNNMLNDSKTESNSNGNNNKTSAKKRSPSSDDGNIVKKLKNGEDCYDGLIKNITVTNINKSDELQFYRLHYTQNKRKKAWDFFRINSTCATLVHNISRNVFVLVRKFSPAVYANVYLNEATSNGVAGKNTKVATACLTQLCSVFYSSSEQPCAAASDNVFRTFGYKVCSKDIQKILHCRSNIGLAGSLLTLLYVKVTDDMLVRASVDNHSKTSPSKSTPWLSEDILDVIEVPVLKSKQNNDKSQHVDGLTMAMANENPLSLSLALLWFYLQQHSKPVSVA